MNQYDIIIIGSGIAALTVAQRLKAEKNILIFTKSDKFESNSYLAQGGVAVAIDNNDNWIEHYQDTLIAGAYHNAPENVKFLTKEAPKYISHLITEGMEFDKDSTGQLSLGREGGHLKRRILHAQGDATGKILCDFMMNQVKNQVTIVENEMVIDLLMSNGECNGVTTKNSLGEVYNYFAGATIIATGGCGQVYEYTSNARTITGDGIAMAYRAGAVLTDMEFVQFHPTILYKDGKTLGLVSEAVRGEGAFLQNSHGERFMEEVHELIDLAPRDIVARAIYRELEKGEKVFLNIENVKDFELRFPTINQLCLDHGINPQKHLLPVIPGAHFLMGGIKTNELGETSVSRLYAVGEAACTGVHGANRIASNSLLEGIVFGNRTAEALLDHDFQKSTRSESSIKPATKNNKLVKLPTKQEIKSYMSKFAGVVRNNEDLTLLKNWLELYKFFDYHVESLTLEEIEIVNMLTVSWLITTSAIKRKESIGSHFRSDYPFFKKYDKRVEITRQFTMNQTVAVRS